MPVQVHRHDRLGAGGDRGLDGGRCGVEVIEFDVDEYRGRPGQGDGVRGRSEAERRYDDFVAGPDTRGEERHVKRGGSRVDGDGVHAVDDR